MDTLKRLHEYISALADGELADCERELALAALDSPEGRTAWRAYHLTGDVLRAGGAAAELSADFSARLATRLADEPAHQPAIRPGTGRVSARTAAPAAGNGGDKAVQPAQHATASAASSAGAGHEASPEKHGAATEPPAHAILP